MKEFDRNLDTLSTTFALLKERAARLNSPLDALLQGVGQPSTTAKADEVADALDTLRTSVKAIVRAKKQDRMDASEKEKD